MKWKNVITKLKLTTQFMSQGLQLKQREIYEKFLKFMSGQQMLVSSVSFMTNIPRQSIKISFNRLEFKVS